MITTNEGKLDRLLRATVGAALMIAGFFWLGNVLMWFALAIGVVLIATAIFGYCGLYSLLKKDTLKFGMGLPKWGVYLWLGLLVVAVVAGAWASSFFTRKFFLEDYNAMNAPYKQALYQTGQGKAELSASNMAEWNTRAQEFQTKYSDYRPCFLKTDKLLAKDFEVIDGLKNQAVNQITAGDLENAHLTLEKVRPIYNEMLKRNGFSLLAVALVDFHDVMETVLDAADAKDAELVQSTYADADTKLKEVEVQANDQEIQDIRANLEAVRSASLNNLDALPDLAAKLKSSFVKVYLSRG